jgi:hypothetical protein
MSRKGWIWVLSILLLLGGVGLFVALDDRSAVQRFENLPWQIDVRGPDRTQVLGVVLGESTLSDLGSGEVRLPIPEVRLFVEPDGTRSVEAYYSNARIPPFEANLVMLLELDAADLERIWNERTSERPTPSGARRYGVSDAALRELSRVPVVEMSYAPRARWEADLLRERFGEPSAQIRLDEDQTYWLYPDRALAIMVPTGRGRTLMHYVTLDRWDGLLERLEKAGSQLLDDVGQGDAS